MIITWQLIFFNRFLFGIWDRFVLKLCDKHRVKTINEEGYANDNSEKLESWTTILIFVQPIIKNRFLQQIIGNEKLKHQNT